MPYFWLTGLLDWRLLYQPPDRSASPPVTRNPGCRLKLFDLQPGAAFAGVLPSARQFLSLAPQVRGAIAKCIIDGPFLCAGGKLAGMKLQFSLATLLGCMTVFSIVAAVCVNNSVPVYNYNRANMSDSELVGWRPPNGWETMQRLTTWEPPIVLATFGLLYAIRRLRSRRHTEPPVGLNMEA